MKRGRLGVIDDHITSGINRDGDVLSYTEGSSTEHLVIMIIPLLADHERILGSVKILKYYTSIN